MYTKEQLQKVFQAKGYKFYEDAWKLNIIGVRKAAGTLDKFDDFLCLVYLDGNTKQWVVKEWPITTEAGIPYFLKPLNPKGTAIVAEGQYIDSHSIGKHQGKYEALVQTGKLRVYRDNNKDNKADLVNLQDSVGDGINIHSTKLGLINKIVSTWSAACQVFVNWADFEAFMAICRVAKGIHGNKFTYTLINTNDIK